VEAFLLGLVVIIFVGKIVSLLLEDQEEWVILLKIIVALWILQFVFNFWR
jgi:hypothetical protein